MALYELGNDQLRPIEATRFADAGIHERQHLQPLLRDRIDVIAPDTYVVAEEYGDWDDSRRRIDLLCIDRDANLVVVELKRSEDGGHMELQALRYAAMVATLTFDEAVEAHRRYLRAVGRAEVDARQALLGFLEWDAPDEEAFGQDVRIVRAAAEFSKELMAAVLWLNERDLDIRCVRMRPLADGQRTLLDVHQVVPLPEASDYQFRRRAKAQRERSSRSDSRERMRFDLYIGDRRIDALVKRWLVFHVVKYLCDQGVHPDEISTRVRHQGAAPFRRVPGRHPDEESFIQAASAEARRRGRAFDPSRFFTQTDQLVVTAENTYAISNQWGQWTMSWLREVLTTFPDYAIDIRETGAGEGE